jgi:hypothetical protein
MITLLSMKRYAAFIILLFLIPNICSLLFGHESFPFTPAPMFTHYVDKNSHVYEFQFDGLSDTGVVKLKPYHKDNKGFLSENRFFFDQIYGSVEHNYPIGTVKNDSKERFTRRLSSFFSVYFDYPEARNVRQIKLVVNEYDKDYKRTASHVVGVYDNLTKEFKHTWVEPQ